MVSSLSVTGRSWRDSLRLETDMFYLYITKNPLIFFAIYMHMHLFAPLTTFVLPKQNQTQQKTQNFPKVFLPRNREK